jgi:hypothetical protein
MKKKYKKFIINTMLFTIILYVGTIVLLFLIVKMHNDKNYQMYYTALLDIKMNIENEDNDTIFVGDSSLLNGLNTIYFNKLSKHKAINLALIASSSPISYRLVVDEYMKKNKAPKNIVIYFSAFSPYRYEDSSFEKTYTLIKHATLKELLYEVTSTDVIMSGITILKLYVKTFLGVNRFSYSDYHNIIILNKGYHFEDKKSLPDNKVFDSSKNKKLYINHLINLKKYFKSYGINTILYVAPMTLHEKSFFMFKDRYDGVTANELKRLPNKYFTDATHLTFDGAKLNTEYVYKDLVNYLQ